MTLPVLVINRDCDRDRWDRTSAAALAQGVDPIRIAAVDAHASDFLAADHAALIGPTFWGRDTIKPGALGCFLSHRRAWERVVRAGWQAALILEDDADLSDAPDRIRPALAGCDLLFANDRMADWVRASGLPGEAVPLPDLVAALAPLGGPAGAGIRRAPGGDAYAVTAQCARRLLSVTAQMRIVCGVDWAMIWAALPGETPLAGIDELETLQRTAPRPKRPVAARALARPVARLRKGPSVLKHSIEVAIRDLPGLSHTR